MTGIQIATVADAGDIAAIYAPYVLETAISFEEMPPTREQMAARMASILHAAARSMPRCSIV